MTAQPQPPNEVLGEVADASLAAGDANVVDARIAAPPVAKPPTSAERAKRRQRQRPAAEPPQTWLGRILRAIERVAHGWERVFGAVSMMVILAVLATVPVLNLLSLGYLLEASGRVGRTGKLRAGFIGLPKAYRVGSIVAGTWFMLLPLYFLSDVWYEASLIDPHSATTFGWRVALIICTMVIVAHILLAWYSGGKLRHFFWPLIFPLEVVYGMLVWTHRKQALHNHWPPPVLLAQGVWKGDLYTAARDEVWNFAVGLRLPHYFWLGLRGFAGAVAWLALPVAVLLLSANLNEGGGALFGFLGSLLLALVVLYLPFLQAQFAIENRLRAMFDWVGVRRHFRRAPLAFWTALAITLLFALPLYLLKIEVTPAEVTWLPALVFVAFIFPARLITGWAMSRARRRQEPRFFLIHWAARLGALPVAATYAFFVYLSQYLSWYGAYSFFDQHAFLVPVPFLGI